MGVPSFEEMFGEMLQSRGLTYSPGGEARHVLWDCKDGWMVGYTTERIRGGPFDGKFAVMAYRPIGKGSQSGKAQEWKRVVFSKCATRKRARERAEILYRKHNARKDPPVKGLESLLP